MRSFGKDAALRRDRARVNRALSPARHRRLCVSKTEERACRVVERPTPQHQREVARRMGRSGQTNSVQKYSLTGIVAVDTKPLTEDLGRTRVDFGTRGRREFGSNGWHVKWGQTPFHAISERRLSVTEKRASRSTSSAREGEKGSDPVS